MCLETIDKKTKFAKRRIGYKVMRQNPNGSFSGLHYGGNHWIGSPCRDRYKRQIQGGTWGERFPYPYPSGFHIYPHQADADTQRFNSGKSIKVVKVKFSEVTASGKQWGVSVVVAKQMTILEITK